MILLFFVLFIVLITAMGTAIGSLIFKQAEDYKKFVFSFPVIGFVYLQLIFISVYWLSNSAFVAFLIALIIGCLLSISSIFKKTLFDFWSFIKIPGLVAAAGLLAFMFFPYFIKGFGNYWQTANTDILGLINVVNYLLSPGSDPLQYGTYFQYYSGITGQFLTLAFSSLFVNSPLSADGYLLLAAVNSLFFCFGIYVLAHRSFGLGRTLSMVAALTSLLSNLYFTSFLNSHLGSQIFNGLVPYLIYFFFEYIKKHSYYLLYVLLPLIIYIYFTYKFPLVFFIGPIILMILYDIIKSQQYQIIYRIVGIIIILIIVPPIVYYLFDGYSWLTYNPEDKPRAWWIALEPEMLLIYWGLLMSNVTNSLNFNSFFYNNFVYLFLMYSVALLFIIITIVGFIESSIKNKYWIFFILTLICGFIGIRFVIKDPYYTYKLLYISQFMVIILLVSGFKKILNQNSVLLNVLSILLILIFYTFNLSWNLLNNATTLNIDANEYATEFASIGSVDKNILSNSAYDIAPLHLIQIINLSLHSKDIPTPRQELKDAGYVITMKPEKDIYFKDIYNDSLLVYRDNLFKVFKKPENYFDINTGTNWPQLDHDKERLIRWADRFSISGFSKKYSNLCVCMEAGPGVGYEPIGISIYNNDSFINHEKLNALQCKYYEINRHFNYTFIPDTPGIRLLPYDERRLVQKIKYLGFCNEQVNIDILRLLNPPYDVIPAETNESLAVDSLGPNTILLGNGWWPQEMEGWRWGSSDMQLLLMNSTADTINIIMELEPGPSLSQLPLQFQIFNDKGTIIHAENVYSRDTSLFALRVKKGVRLQEFSIKVLNETRPLTGKSGITLFDIRINIPDFLNPKIKETRNLNLKLYRLEEAYD